MLGAGLRHPRCRWCAPAAMLIAQFLVAVRRARSCSVAIYNAAGQYYRFAAADVAAPDFKSKAISLVLAGGIVGGILGPETSKLTKDLLPAHTLRRLLSRADRVLRARDRRCMRRLRDTAADRGANSRDHGRPLREIAQQPDVHRRRAVRHGRLRRDEPADDGHAARHDACQHPFSDAAFVIQWHVVGMFAPSFFTGTLIKRFGLMQVMLTGVALNFGCVAVALSRHRGDDISGWRWCCSASAGISCTSARTTLLTDAIRPPNAPRRRASTNRDFHHHGGEFAVLRRCCSRCRAGT